MNILVTGAAGFIGFYLISRLVREGYKVVGIDSLNDFSNINQKFSRLKKINEDIDKRNEDFYFKKIDLSCKNDLEKVFEKFQPQFVYNLSAHGGVRYSIENPFSYLQPNLVGFFKLSVFYFYLLMNK